MLTYRLINRFLAYGIMLALSLAADASATERDIIVVGAKPAPAFVAAAQAAGFTVTSQAEISLEAQIVCLVTPIGGDSVARERIGVQAEAFLLEGKTLIVSFGGEPAQAESVEPLLPINLWSVRGEKHSTGSRLQRGDCGAIGQNDWNIPGLRFSHHYDLHLPYAAIEAGEHRLQPEAYGKTLLNTDWNVLLNCDIEGQLPLLISSRYWPGRVMVLGAGLFDESLVRSPGYAKFVGRLLAAAKPGELANQADTGIGMSIDLHQPRKLHVSIETGKGAPARVLLVYKIRNAEQALLNSASIPLELPADHSTEVELQEHSPMMGDPDAIASADKTMPYRWVDAAIVSSDRRKVICKSRTLVDTAEAVTLEIRGEDIRSSPLALSWPDREMGRGVDMAGGAPIDRYVYFASEAPQLSVSLRNGLHNIAPLAKPRDMNWEKNPTTQGLNDLAVSDGGVRGVFPSFGAWAGKSAPVQDVSLTWGDPVWIAGNCIVGQTHYRNWDRSNPPHYELWGQALSFLRRAPPQLLASAPAVEYVLARHQVAFPPVQVIENHLHITGLDPAADLEPKLLRDTDGYKKVATNCSIVEWEVLGWPESEPPPAVKGQLTVIARNLLTGAQLFSLQQNVSLEAFHEVNLKLPLPALVDLGPVHVDATLLTALGAKTTAAFDLLVVDPKSKSIEPNPVSTMGLLCSPGFINFDEFGLGTTDDTQGWGGDDDKIWALTHDFLELGRRSVDASTRMFTTSGRFCHYTDPWRDFPSGEYFWDFAGQKLEEMFTTGKYKNRKVCHLFLSDRWNGIPVGASFTWADYIAFDQYLRATEGHGLKGRSRKQIADEVATQYGDVWQKWEMNRYADKLLEVQQRLAKIGVAFSVTTHGSFPLVGGELGEKIGKTHKAVGTDLFWELRAEDLIGTIGYRFGLIAANPDFESGAYNEWGWCSSAMNNPHWFGYSGAVEPARRQWYATYFAGRIISSGEFEPLTKFGYYAQGGFGPKNTQNDWQNYYRTMHFTDRVRPESPAGFGLVVSWKDQERRMGKKIGALGFGLYAAADFPQIDAMAGNVYSALVKNGVPIAFVASTHTLRNWKGKNPLIVVEGYNLEKGELKTLTRLNAAGAPIFAIGMRGADTAETRALYGVSKSGHSFDLAAGTQAVSFDNPFEKGAGIFLRHPPGSVVTALAPADAEDISVADGQFLARAILAAAGSPLELPPGITATPFVSGGHLFLALIDQGDVNRQVSVSLRPGLLAPGFNSDKYRVIDIDRGVELPVTNDHDKITVSLPVAASDGRLLMIVK